MDKKIQDYYQKNRLRIEELIKKIVKIDQIDETDFRDDIIETAVELFKGLSEL